MIRAVCFGAVLVVLGGIYVLAVAGSVTAG